MLLGRRFVLGLRSRPKSHLALALVIATNQMGIIVLAAGSSSGAVIGSHIHEAACADTSAAPAREACSAQPADTGQLRVALPEGVQQCPASGPGASCTGIATTPLAAPGVSSLPDGLDACPVLPGKSGPDAPASCSDTLLPTTSPADTAGRVGAPLAASPVTPSPPASSLQSTGPQQRLELSTQAPSVEPGKNAVLVATSNMSVTGTPNAIEIFDQTAGTLAGVCLQASQCKVAYASQSGLHTFAAFVTPPTATVPIAAAAAESNPVSVAWLRVTLAAGNPSVIAPGRAITFTATATTDVGKLGYPLELYDEVSGARLTYCSRGTTCSTTLTQPTAGAHSIVAYVAATSDSLPAQGVLAASNRVPATWLSVSLAANTTFPQAGGTVYLRATANADLTDTPWSIGIYDDEGHLVDAACKSGATCTARITLSAGSTPWFNAVIGATPPADMLGPVAAIMSRFSHVPSLVNVQAHSAPVQPTRLLWGVDSCKLFTSDSTASGGLYPQVASSIGSPDFWGRYLTTTPNCPGLSAAEVDAAKSRHMGILPIYNDYDCSAVGDYETGRTYAIEASRAARSLSIPRGRVIAIDVEPPGPWCSGAVDAQFIEGWYDGVMLYGFAPTYYGNGTGGTEFAQAWCGAVADRPEIAADSYLWSFEPSLLGSYSKAMAPEYAPYQPGCGGNFAAWQYQISTGGTPDVDHDEALSNLPLWFP